MLFFIKNLGMDFFAQYNLSLDELGITDMNTFQDNFESVAPLAIAYAEATAAADASLDEWISWIRARNNELSNPSYQETSRRLMENFGAAESAQKTAYAAVQVALNGEEAWQEVLRLEQAEKDAECRRGLEEEDV
jgi:hypothetical protein